MTAMMVRNHIECASCARSKAVDKMGVVISIFILYKGIFKVGEDQKGTRALPVSGQATILACFHADALSYVPLKH